MLVLVTPLRPVATSCTTFRRLFERRTFNWTVSTLFVVFAGLVIRATSIWCCTAATNNSVASLVLRVPVGPFASICGIAFAVTCKCVALIICSFAMGEEKKRRREKGCGMGRFG